MFSPTMDGSGESGNEEGCVAGALGLGLMAVAAPAAEKVKRIEQGCSL